MNATPQTMVQLNGIGKTWPDGTRALNTVDLEVPEGQFCVILGPSGAGKSTLLRAVNGLMQPTEGKVNVDGIELTPGTEKALRKKVAMIHQHFNLATRASVAANVLSGALPDVSLARALCGWFHPEQRAKACHYLERVGLKPDHLRRRAGELSGGQQQRVGIARAFMLDPKVVLADEPVASLDPKISRDILALLRDAARDLNATVICSLHQVDLAREFGDRIVGMRDGEVVFDGTPDEFDEQRLNRLYHNADWGDGEPREDHPEAEAEPARHAAMGGA
ncbi:phosphonate ABC transporter ATP-binding protein [Marinobacter sp.]|uniref:phosphonate ABC transporter ATP-binding protein n=1 Tax=Marinobacter sp. TaxID=50741 RepID=UPI0025C3A1D1|nr:phosphonate ABC transporter ATP-binding protein [Marinobacter sp.]